MVVTNGVGVREGRMLPAIRCPASKFTCSMDFEARSLPSGMNEPLAAYESELGSSALGCSPAYSVLPEATDAICSPWSSTLNERWLPMMPNPSENMP